MTAPPQPAADSMLIERMMAGDENAFSTLYDRYAAMLYGLLMRILQNKQAAEEVLQDVFLQLWRKPAQFDPGRGALPAAWLLVIARNRAISRLRGHTREVLEESDGLYANTFASTQNIEDEAARGELMGKLKSALTLLPPEQRQVVELAYFEGMTQTEIAARTGSPLGTVKTRARSAMQSLKELLG